jgi:hypothetical protein
MAVLTASFLTLSLKANLLAPIGFNAALAGNHPGSGGDDRGGGRDLAGSNYSNGR